MSTLPYLRRAYHHAKQTRRFVANLPITHPDATRYVNHAKGEVEASLAAIEKAHEANPLEEVLTAHLIRLHIDAIHLCALFDSYHDPAERMLVVGQQIARLVLDDTFAPMLGAWFGKLNYGDSLPDSAERKRIEKRFNQEFYREYCSLASEYVPESLTPNEAAQAAYKSLEEQRKRLKEEVKKLDKARRKSRKEE